MNMKKIYLYTLLLGLVGLTSCEDDASPVLSVKTNAELEALPQAEYTFTEANAKDAFTIKWNPVDYGFQGVNSYTVVMSNPANGKSVKLGETSDQELALTNGEINNYLGELNVYPGQAGELAISLGYSAYEGKLDSVAGNVITFKATPYDPKVANITWDYAYVATYPAASVRAGGDVDWDWTKAYMLGDVDGDGSYEGWVNIDEDNVAYKVLDGKTYEVLAEGTTIEKKGFYQISLNGGTLTQSAEPTVWGVIGDATSGKWDKETAMEYNPDTRLWTVVTSLLAGKEIKFKSDQGMWLGVTAGEETNMGGEINGGNNIKIVADKDTTYLVTLDLTEAGKYSYSLKAVEFEQSSEFITLPGNYQGTVEAEQWKPEEKTAVKLLSEARDFNYSGTAYMPAGTLFKFYDGGTWIGLDGKIAWKDSDKTSGNFALKSGGGDNIELPVGAYYRFDVNLKKLTAEIHKTGWEVIGDATPGAWDKGTVMDYNPDTKLWSVTITLTDGEMKFRWDGGWDINLGGSLGALTQGGENMKALAGTYDIVLDPEAKKATMTKK